MWYVTPNFAHHSLNSRHVPHLVAFDRSFGAVIHSRVGGAHVALKVAAWERPPPSAVRSSYACTPSQSVAFSGCGLHVLAGVRVDDLRSARLSDVPAAVTALAARRVGNS